MDGQTEIDKDTRGPVIDMGVMYKKERQKRERRVRNDRVTENDGESEKNDQSLNGMKRRTLEERRWKIEEVCKI